MAPKALARLLPITAIIRLTMAPRKIMVLGRFRSLEALAPVSRMNLLSIAQRIYERIIPVKTSVALRSISLRSGNSVCFSRMFYSSLNNFVVKPILYLC